MFRRLPFCLCFRCGFLILAVLWSGGPAIEPELTWGQTEMRQTFGLFAGLLVYLSVWLVGWLVGLLGYCSWLGGLLGLCFVAQ